MMSFFNILEKNRIAAVVIMILAVSTGLMAEECSTMPACENTSQPAEAETYSAPPAVAPEALKILNRLEQAGDQYKTLRANVEYLVEDKMTGDEEFRTGWIAYQKETENQPGKFRVSFEQLTLGKGRPTTSKQDYLFDGQWLTTAKHRIKEFRKIQVAAEGEKIDAMKIGKGPFPVPFGQKTDDVVKYLEPSTRPNQKGDPKNSSYLKFVPRKGQGKDVNFVRLDMWVDNETNLPVKIQSKDASKKVTTVTFKDIQPKSTLQPELFIMTKPAGWDLIVEPLK